MFGEINEDRFTGEIKYASVIRKGYWEVELEGVWLGTKKVPTGAKAGSKINRAAIDTGTSLCAIPTASADYINKAIGATKGWTGQWTVGK